MARPRKRETEEKHLARILNDIVKTEHSLSDAAAIIACFKDDVKTLEKIKEECKDIDEFMDRASTLANIQLTAAAMREAMGYDYEDWDQKVSLLYRYDDHGNQVCNEVPGEKKIKKKHARGNETLLKFILSNRMPEYFSDVKKLEINKKTIQIKQSTAEEIKNFAGKLADVIEADFAETDNGN